MKWAAILKLLAACSVAAAFAEVVHANRWWHVREAGVAPNRAEQFVDQSSIRTNVRRHKIIWTMTVLETPLGSGVASMKSVYEVDCKGRRSRSLARIGLDIDGARVAGVERAPLPWTRVASGTTAAQIQRIACTGKMPAEAMNIEGLDPRNVSETFFAQGVSPVPASKSNRGLR